MGTWGTSVFADDTASDIRVDFRELIGDGLSPQEATARIVREYRGTFSDRADAAGFWIALAATQWKLGRLQKDVRDRAIAAIDRGDDLKRWEDAAPRDRAKRQSVLLALREQLLSPQPPAKKVRPVYHDRTEWDVGHLVAYRLMSGAAVVLRVIAIDTQAKERTAVVDLCDWVGSEPPPPATLARMPRKRTRHFKGEDEPPFYDTDGKFAVYSLRPTDFPADRLTVLATNQRVRPEPKGTVGATYFGGWKKLDEHLREWFAVR